MGGGGNVWRRTSIVDGSLAFRTARLDAACAGAIGLEILTLPLLAARLAGGFCRMVDRASLSTGVTLALGAGGFSDIETVRQLPGTPRAVIDSLQRLWSADLNLSTLTQRSARLADMALIERRLRDSLPAGDMLPQDLRDAAVARAQFAPMLVGELTLHRVMQVDPIWRPLLCALAQHIHIRWINPIATECDWFTGELISASSEEAKPVHVDLCADPHTEVVEALRWARCLLSSGAVRAADVAIAAASPAAWDEQMLVLSRDADLPIHFSHGIPALNTSEGQACAALGDLLVSGLSQDRIRRLLRWTSSAFSRSLPPDWATGLPRRAGLFSVEQWRQALSAAREQRESGDAAELVLLPLLELAAQGSSRADDIGKLVLPSASLGLWSSALQTAPAAAVALSLKSMRVRDDRDPGNSIVWAPAVQLVGVPRPYTRLLGIVGRAWPRPDSEDALVPDHVLPRRDLLPISVTERDRGAFRCLMTGGAKHIAISRSQRSAEGTLQCASALWPASVTATTRSRIRIPDHAFNEADRVFARPSDAAQIPRVKTSRICWRNWHDAAVTANDGLTRPSHPAVQRAIDRLQSPTSLRQLVRDPLGFLWHYALDMKPIALAQRPLAFDAAVFGELVHDLLKRTVDTLEPDPGLVRASRDQIEQALEQAVGTIRDLWPLHRAVPPPLLWEHALDEAARRSRRALTLDESFQPGTRSWTEFAFGMAGEGASEGPWPAEQEVTVGASHLKLGGRIDRIDMAAGGAAIRLSDYKTEQVPKKAERIILNGGREVQRVLYAIAARQLCPDTRQLTSRLIYLREDMQPFSLRSPALDGAAEQLVRYVDAACNLLSQGKACPGPDGQERYNEFKLALPSDVSEYFRRKGAAFAALHQDLAPLWSKP